MSLVRRTGVFKRPAAIADRSIRRRAFVLSKSDWTDLYFDLYRQCFGQSTPETEILVDAERRVELLRLARQRVWEPRR